MDIAERVFRLLQRELKNTEAFNVDQRIQILGLMVDLANGEEAKLMVDDDDNDA